MSSEDTPKKADRTCLPPSPLQFKDRGCLGDLYGQTIALTDGEKMREAKDMVKERTASYATSISSNTKNLANKAVSSAQALTGNGSNGTEALLSNGAELSDGTKESTAPSGGNGGIYGCILLLLASALAIVLAIRAHFRGGLMADVEKLQDWAAGVPGTVTGGAMYIFGELQEADDHAEVCNDGLLLSGPSMTPLNAGFYVFLLLWSFVGVAIAADVFMVAIEVITSSESTKVVTVNGVTRTFTVQVWNATVANLTLMALGSSAPEILLSVIEITTGGFFAGELGPSTIVGSAAFNLLVISAVCIAAIPAGESRLIKDKGVFYITGAFSILAYVWLVVILQINTPNFVDIWEGIVTFLAFPFLVWLAYLADSGALSFKADGCCKILCCRRRRSPGATLSPGTTLLAVSAVDEEAADDVGKEVNRLLAMSADTHLTTEDREKAMADAQKLMKHQAAGKEKPKSRAYYRVHATGLSKVQSKDSATIKAEKAAAEAAARSSRKLGDASLQLAQGAFQGAKGVLSSIAPAKCVVEFAEPGLAVPEDIGSASVKVVRSGTLMSTVTVRYSTKAGTATAGLDYTEVSGDLTFFPGQSFATIKVPIIDDDEIEEKETFTVLLEAPDKGQVIIGSTDECTVTIEDNDSPGNLKFDKEYVPVKESAGKVTCTVVRVGGTAGTVGCSYATKEKSAKQGADFVHTEGVLTFGPGVTRKEVTIEVVDDANFEKDESFQLVLTDASGGAAFTADTDGGSARAICTIKILNDEERQTLLGLMVSELDLDVDSVKLAGVDYMEQIRTCLDYEGGSCASALLYVLSLPFKVVFAFTPPPQLGGGWPCFMSALVLIGGLTALIGDLASHVGCCLGLLPAVTAITFVAMGTSLPDTFASKQSAMGEPYADNSIGNVTGSNSVNVFLGLGLAWLISAIYWDPTVGVGATDEWKLRYPDILARQLAAGDTPGGFVVYAGDLGFSVLIFTIFAIIALSLILLRRPTELGGNRPLAFASAALFVLLWIMYVLISALTTYKYITPPF